MSFQIPRIRTCVLLVFAAAAIACNQAALGRVPVYPARGKALYKGSPLPGALVVFEPIGATADGTGSANIAGQLRATGRTGPDGSFQLRTYQGDEWLFFLVHASAWSRTGGAFTTRQEPSGIQGATGADVNMEEEHSRTFF